MSGDFVIAEVSLAKLEDFPRLAAANVRIGPVIVPVGLWLWGRVEFGANVFDPRVRAAIAEELRQTALKKITDAWMQAAEQDAATIHAMEGVETEKDGGRPSAVRNGFLDIKLDELELGRRTYNALRMLDASSVKDIVQLTEHALLKIPGFGRKSLNELAEVLDSLGVYLAGRRTAPKAGGR